MTDSSRVLSLLEEGNPAPDIAAETWSVVDAAAYLTALREGETATSGHGGGKSKKGGFETGYTRSTLSRRWSIAWGRAAACIAVLVAIGYVLQADREPSTTAAAAVELAESFMDALNEHDVDAMLALSGPDMVSIDNSPDGTIEGFRAWIDQQETLGWTYHFNCDVATTNPARTIVRCPYSFSNHISEVYGLGTYPGSYTELWIESGKVTLFVQQEYDDAFHGEGGGLGMFAAWVFANYPETTGIDFHYYYTDQTNFEFWEEYMPLFLASEGVVDLTPLEIAKRVMDGLNAHDPDVLVALSSPEVIAPSSPNGTYEGFEYEIEQERFLGWHYDYTCDMVSATETGTSIECPYSFSNHITEAFGLDPYQGSKVTMRVVDSEIVDFAIDEASESWQGEGGGLDLFQQWMVDNHPEDSEGFDYNYTDRTNLDFWKKYIPLLLASETDGGQRQLAES